MLCWSVQRERFLPVNLLEKKVARCRQNFLVETTT